MQNLLTQLKKKRKKLDSPAHRESFEKYGFCMIPRCRCSQRKPMSFHRVVMEDISGTDLKKIKRKKKKKKKALATFP